MLHDNGNMPRHILLSSQIEAAISLKRQEWQNNPCELEFIIQANAKPHWIYAAPNDIKRTLSNLLNNAYESLRDHKKIQIILELDENHQKLHIHDTGSGIPESKMTSVLSGISLKHEGKGLGLSSAILYMSNIGGKLELSSTEGVGTHVALTFPLAAHPTWYPEKIIYHENMPIVVLDDESCMHSLWRHRFQSIGILSLHFSSSSNIIDWYENNPTTREQVIFLVDYELRDGNNNGLEILQKFNAKQRGYLITSHAEEIALQKQCERLGIWLIPKSLANDTSFKLHIKI